MSVTAYIALGSNLGDSEAMIREAARALAPLSSDGVQLSSLYHSTPVDCPPGSPDFINAVVRIKTLQGETPETLLGKLQALEKQFGRTKKRVHNEARPLDLDLLTFGNETRETPFLTLPHPRAPIRGFVLLPLSELAPELVLPKQTQPVFALLRDLPAESLPRRR